MGRELDFEAEGLLEGVDGDRRAARLRLLERLVEEGVPVAELRHAAREGRLALLPVERALSGEGARFTADEVADRSGVEREFLDRQWRALGLALADDDEAIFTESDVAAASRVAALRKSGVPDEGILEIARLLGMTMSQLAAANRSMIAGAFVAEGDAEDEVAERLATATALFMPIVGESLSYVLNLHLREQIRHDALAGGAADAGDGDPATEVTVCFVDMVGFTQLGETLAPEELGAVTGRLAELAVGVVEPPVRLVKLIGDAAMIAGPEPRGVVDAALELVACGAREGGAFPILRAGVAGGEALPRGGDWYGRPVNLASRITGRARPGSVLASEEVHDALESEYRWSFAGAKRLKGIGDEVKVYRCRPRSAEEDAEVEREPGLTAALLEGIGEMLEQADGDRDAPRSRDSR